MTETDRDRELPPTTTNAAGWRWLPDDGAYTWWDGTSLAHSTVARPPRPRNGAALVGVVVTILNFTTVCAAGVILGPLGVGLGLIGLRRARIIGGGTSMSTVVIVAGVASFFLGLIWLLAAPGLIEEPPPGWTPPPGSHG